MKKGLLLLTIVAVMAFMAPAFVFAETAGPYHWESAYFRETPAKIAAAYVTLKNPTISDDALIGAKAEWAGRIELHSIVTAADGVMKMTPVKEMSLPANGMLELSPGGYHLMIFDIKQESKVDEKKNITLMFRKAGDLVIPFAVQPLSGLDQQAHNASDHMGHDMSHHAE